MSAEVTVSNKVEFSFHNVKKIGLQEIREGRGYNARTLVILDKDNNEFEISIFADDPKDLEVFKMEEE